MCVSVERIHQLQLAWPFQVNKLEITSDKTQIAAAGNGSIRIFDVNSSDTQPVTTYEGHSGNVSAIGFQKDTKWMFSGRDKVVT